MDVPEHFLPPGRHLLDAAGGPAVDGLAATFSRKVEEMGRVGQAAAYLFSIAERSLVTVSSAADVLAAEQTAVEALNLFVAAQDQQGVAWAMRLVIHAVRTGAAWRCESPANVYEALESFLEEELRRARLFEDHFAEATALLSLAEVKLDQAHYEKCLELAQAARQIFESDNAAGCRLGQGLCWLRTAEAQLRSYQFHQGQDSASRALHCFNGTDHAHSIGRARFLLAAGLRLQQKHAAVVSAVKEALPLAQEAGDQRLLAGLMYLLACSCYQKGGRFREAAQAATEALQLCLETGEVWGFAEMSLAVKVKALWSESSQQLAMDALQQHMRRARDFASRLLTRQVWVQLFKRMDGPTELQKAHAICDKNLVALRAKSTQGTQGAEWQARELELIASLHSKLNTRKKVEEALQWALQAKQQLHLSGQKYLEADAIPSIANCHILLGEATKASSVLSERRQLFRDLNARSREAEAMLELADALCREQVSRVDSRARRFLRDSFQICQDALNAFSDVGHETGMAKAHLLLADIYLYRQEPEEAEKEARRAEQLYREAGEAKLVARAVRKLGLALCERDLPQEAARSASEAVVFCKKAGDRYALADTLGWEAQMHSQNVGKNIEGLPEKDAQKIVFRSLSKLMTPAKEAVLLARKLQDKGLIASTLCSVGEVEASVGKWDAALCATAEAAVLSQKIADCATESRALVLSSEIHFRKKEFVLARDEAERAFKLVKNTFSWEARRNAEKALKRTGGCASYDES